MLVGLYGGTFDPIHLGHIKIAKAAVEQFNLDELWFIPAKIPPHKQASVIADEKQRLDMLKLARENLEEKFKICKYELEKESISYSYITLTDFKNMYPDYKFIFIIGEDSLEDFEKWKNPDIISKLVEIAVVPRFNSDYNNINSIAKLYNKKYGTLINILDFSLVKISSTEVRKMISEGKDASDYVGKEVYDYIVRNNLYK